MREIVINHYHEPQHRRHKRGRRRVLFWIIAILIFASLIIYTRPTTALYPSNYMPAKVNGSPNLTWPSGGESAVGAVGYGVLATHNAQSSRPTASVAKVITALTVLNKYPLAGDQPGPTIVLKQADVDIYRKYMSEQGTVAKVTAGEKISEHQALEAMLLPSSNNMADSLANWAFGSLANYHTAANRYVKSIGLYHTHIGSDASGFLPNTTSTAQDLVGLGMVAMQSPLLRHIFAEQQAKVPVSGTLPNGNNLLGNDGIIGIKTGNTDQAGGVYLFAATAHLSPGHDVIIVGAIQGTHSLIDAFGGAIALLESVKVNFHRTAVIKAGQPVAEYTLPWGGKSQALATSNITAYSWAGTSPKPVLSLHAIYPPMSSHADVGSLSIVGGDKPSDVTLAQNLPSPPSWWRIARHDIRPVTLISKLTAYLQN